MRAFFAIELPADLTTEITAVQQLFADASGLSFVDPTRTHVTLKFLGEVAPDDVDAVLAAGERAIEQASVEPFSCQVTDLGVFPSLEYISVVWAGIDEGSAELTRLHEAVEAETTALGVDPSDHAFTPHVTLARMKDARGKAVVQRVVREHDPEIGRFDVTEIRLIESTVTPDGPRYETVARFPL